MHGSIVALGEVVGEERVVLGLHRSENRAIEAFILNVDRAFARPLGEAEEVVLVGPDVCVGKDGEGVDDGEGGVVGMAEGREGLEVVGSFEGGFDGGDLGVPGDIDLDEFEGFCSLGVLDELLEREWVRAYCSVAMGREDEDVSRLRYSVLRSHVTLPRLLEAGAAVPEPCPLANGADEEGSARRNASRGSMGGRLFGSGLSSG